MLQIEGSDVVLGTRLPKLGRVAHDYSALSMYFCCHGKQVTLHGDLSELPSLISLHQFQALIQSAEMHNIFEIQTMLVDNTSEETNLGDTLELSFSSSLPDLS